MKFHTIVLLGLVGYAAAAPAKSCEDQRQCLDYTITEEAASICTGDCQMRVCVTFDTGMDGPYGKCTKGSGNSISHTCVAGGSDDPQTCEPSYKDLNVDGNQNNLGFLRQKGTQCQTVRAGSVAEFVFKDGNGCSGSSWSGDGVTCAPTSELSCSGAGNIGKECLWRIPTPATCSGTAGTPPPTPGSTPPPTKSPTKSPTLATTPPPTAASNTSPANIKIDKTVLLAGSNVAPASSCNPGKEVVMGKAGQDVVYCYIVTNTGGESLSNVELGDTCLAFSHTHGSVLPPGASIRVPFSHSMSADMSETGCDGTVVGTPVTSGGTVDDTDPAGHRLTETEVDCSMSVSNTVVDGSLMVNTEETCTYCACE